MIISFFLVKKDCPEPPTPTATLRLCKMLSRLESCRLSWRVSEPPTTWGEGGGISYLGKMYGKAGLFDLLCDASGFLENLVCRPVT